MEAGRSYHSVEVLKLNNWQLRALGIHHGDNFEAVATFVLSCECKGENNLAPCNSSMEWLSGSLRIKGAPLATAATAWQAYYSQPPVPNSLGKIYALFSTSCRQEARNRNLGMLRLGQAANIFPSWAVQGGLRSRIDQDLRRLPALSSHRQKTTGIVLLPFITGDSLPIRLSLLYRMGNAGVGITGLPGSSPI